MLTLVLLEQYIIYVFMYISPDLILKTVCSRSQLNKLIVQYVMLCLFSLNINIFRHLILAILSAIPGSNEHYS